jgi:hypothetical protein
MYDEMMVAEMAKMKVNLAEIAVESPPAAASMARWVLAEMSEELDAIAPDDRPLYEQYAATWVEGDPQQVLMDTVVMGIVAGLKKGMSL